MAHLEKDEVLKSAEKEVVSPPNGSNDANQVTQKVSSARKDLFGGGDPGFAFSFGADTSINETSFSFFGNNDSDCKSPEQEKGGEFFLNFGGGDDGDKMEEEGGWNIFGNK